MGLLPRRVGGQVLLKLALLSSGIRRCTIMDIHGFLQNVHFVGVCMAKVYDHSLSRGRLDVKYQYRL